MIKFHHRFALILSIGIFLLYASTTPAINVGYGDSDEFLTVGKTWGLAHPPGYTLYTSMIHLAMMLPVPFTNETQRAHLLSGVLSAIAIYFITRMLFIFTDTKETKNNPKLKYLQIIAITTTAISIATAKLFWIYSQVAEKYILSATFISIIMYLSVKITRSKKPMVADLLSLSLVYGLLISHHQSAVFLLPYLAYVLYQSNIYKDIQHSIKTVSAGLIGFIIPQLLLIIRSNPGTAVSWYIQPGIKGIIDFITRADFRGNIYYTNTISSGYFPQNITLNQITTASTQYVLTILQSYSWWIVVPLLFGVMALWLQDNKTRTHILLPFALMGIALASYLSWPTDLGSQAATVRFYIPSFITLAPILYFGIYELLKRLTSATTILEYKHKGIPNLAPFVILIPLVIAYANINFISIKRFDLISKLYDGILNQVKPNSILTCYSDSSCFALLYEQTVRGQRPDVDIIPLAYPLVNQKYKDRPLHKFNYQKNPYLMFDIVTWNLDKRPVYAVDISRYYFDLYGIDNAFMFYVPNGYVGELSRTIPNSFDEYDTTLSQKYEDWFVSDSDLMQRFLIQSLSQTHMTNAYALLKTGNRTFAQNELSRGVNLVYALTKDEKGAGLETRSQIERIMPDSRFAYGTKVADATTILSHLPNYQDPKQSRQALAIARGAMTVDPTNIQARIELAKLYEKFGDKNFAILEYKHVLMLDEQNKEAQQKLLQLDQ